MEVILKTNIVAEVGYEYYTVRDPITKILTLCRKKYPNKRTTTNSIPEDKSIQPVV